MMALLQETTVATQDTAPGIGLSELLSGFLGALFLFLIGTVRDGWRRRRERLALMTLVHYEIVHNEAIIEDIGDADDPLDTGYIPSLHDDTWKENRTRITQLEAERAVEYLGMYYTSIGTLISMNRLSQDTDGDVSLERVKEIFDSTRNNLGPLARYVCERQTGVVKAWSNGMLVTVGKWEPVKNVEDNWYRCEHSPRSDEDEE